MGLKRSDLDDLLDALERVRDEIGLKIHLAAADARDEWEQLEKQWRHLRGRLDTIGRVAENAAGDVGEAIEQVGKELRKGYERLRRVL